MKVVISVEVREGVILIEDVRTLYVPSLCCFFMIADLHLFLLITLTRVPGWGVRRSRESVSERVSVLDRGKESVSVLGRACVREGERVEKSECNY